MIAGGSEETLNVTAIHSAIRLTYLYFHFKGFKLCQLKNIISHHSPQGPSMLTAQVLYYPKEVG
jgi:hypothetical protein